MPTPLGSLEVEILLRQEKFEASLKAIETRMGGFDRKVSSLSVQVSKGFDSIGSAVSKVQGVFTAFTGLVALGGLTHLATDALDTAGALVDMSDKLGIDVERLQAYHAAAGLAGVSTETFDASISKLEKNIAQAAHGTGEARDELNELGLSAAALATDPAKAVDTVIHKLGALDSRADKIRLTTALFGKQSDELVRILENEAEEFERNAANAKAMGLVIDGNLLRQSEALGDKLETASKIMDVQFKTALLELAPVLVQGASLLARMATNAGQLHKSASDLLGASDAARAAANMERLQQVAHAIIEDQQQLDSIRNRTGLLDFLKSDEAVARQVETLERRLAAFRAEQVRLQQALTHTGTTATNTGQNLDEDLLPPLDEAGQKTKALRDAIEQEIRVTNVKADLLGKVLTGQLSANEATAQMAAAEKTAAAGTEDLAGKLATSKLRLEENEQAVKDLHDAYEDLVQGLASYNDHLKTTEAGLQQEAAAQQLYLSTLKQSIADGKDFEDAQDDAARAIELTTFWWKEYQEALKTLPEQAARDFADRLTVLKDRTIDAKEEAEQLGKAYKESLANALLTTADIDEVITGVLQGMQELPDALEDLGQATGIRLVKGILFGKGKNEQAILGNFNQLLGIEAQGIFASQGFNLGTTLIDNILRPLLSGGNSLLQSVGIDLGGLFGSSSADAAGMEWSSGWDGIFNGTGAGSVFQGEEAGSAWGTAFGQAGTAAAIYIIGSQIGGGLAKLFGLAKSKEARMGAEIAGGLFGGLFGPLGGLIGGLFAHTPTKGTQIRKAVKEYLKDIGASFASAIDTKDYFFEETKALAKKMFGGDFLQASKKILTDKAGPELAKQLQALGTFLTADQALDLGKPVEQTGTTFGNMLLDNLGLDALPDAIAEIIAKGGITFDDIAKKLTSVFEDGAISLEFYRDTIEGAVDIFYGDLPDAINAAAIAQRSFSEEGIFQQEEFNKALEESTGRFNAVSQAFVDAIKNSNSGEEAGKLFGEQLLKGLGDLAVENFLKEFIDKSLFEGIDLSDGLDSGEIETLRQRTIDAKKEADELRAALQGTEAVAAGLVNQIRELNAQLEDLARQRIDVQINLAERLGAIDALDSRQVNAAKQTALQPELAFFLQVRGPNSPLLSDDELTRGLEVLSQAQDLAVERYNAEVDAIQEALRVQLDAIRDETAAKRDAITSTIRSLQNERQQTAELFQARLDGLQAELQIAEQFASTAEGLQQSITGLVTGAQSPLSDAEQLAFLQRQADSLRVAIGDAALADRPELINQLSQILQQELGIGGNLLNGPEFDELFRNVLGELESLRASAGAEGDKARDLQQEIADTQLAMNASLASIDAQIAAQDVLLEQLSREEQLAIKAAQERADVEIRALRAATETTLRDLADRRDEYLREQIARTEEQRDILKQQLVDQFGEQEANDLLRDVNAANLRALDRLNDSLLGVQAALERPLGQIVALLGDFVGGPAAFVTPAANGFEGIVRTPRLFLAGERGPERVSITPQLRTGGGFSLSIGHVSVSLANASPGEAKRAAGQLIGEIIQSVRHGELGTEIDSRMRRLRL